MRILKDRLGRCANRLRLREKMVLTFLLLGFAPMLLVSLLMQNAVIGSLKQEIERSSAKSLEQMAQRIDERIALYNLIADNVVLDHQLTRLLDDSYASLGEAIDLYYYVWNLRGGILRTNPEILSVGLYTAHRDLRSAPPYLFRVDDLAEIADYPYMGNAQYVPWLSGARPVCENRDYWLGDGRNGERAFALSRRINQPNSASHPVGIVTLLIREEALHACLQTNTEYSMALIIDQRDEIVTAETGDEGESARLAGQSVYSCVPEEIWENRRDSCLYDTERGTMRLLTRELRWGWRVATVISIDGLQSQARATQYKGILVILTCAALAVALVALVSARTASRARLLLAKFSVGPDGSLRPGAPIEGGDEIAMLDGSFRRMADQLNGAIHDLYTVELQKKESMLKALQSRINPHFLYNTLSDIGWMTQTHDPDDVRGAIELLATYYRSCLSGGRDVVTLEEELDSLKAYLAIQKLRMGRRIQTVLRADPQLAGIRLPKMTLQPIVENSIEHGVCAAHPGVYIAITTQVEGGDALIHVTDDGPGFGEEALALLRAGSLEQDREVLRQKGRGFSSAARSGCAGAPEAHRAGSDAATGEKTSRNVAGMAGVALVSPGGGYGMRNVQMRLKLYFGEGYGLSFENLPAGGARTTVRIPLAAGEE